MKYCYNCNHITVGEPFFCNFCGRSYNVKLCPRMHRNPRHADVCSRCGSRDLSTPQPRVPLWAPALTGFLPWISGVALGIVSVILIGLLILAFFQSIGAVVGLLFLCVPLGVLWSMWGEVPTAIRTAIFRLVRRLRDGGEEGPI